jgi:monofunctional biosynthetic peptidoglycan transglycosylase
MIKHKTVKLLLLFGIFFLLVLEAKAEDKMTSNHKHDPVLFDFKDAKQLAPWRIVNDGVMGGLSQGQLTHSDNETAIFAGAVSLENNGGFTSTRTVSLNYNLKDHTGILIRVKGDGKNYQFRVRTNGRFDGVSYRYMFATKADTWVTIEIPFDRFSPVFRGRVLNNVGPIVPSNIQQVGFLIANKRSENFKLEIDWIKAYQQN